MNGHLWRWQVSKEGPIPEILHEAPSWEMVQVMEESTFQTAVESTFQTAVEPALVGS